MSDTLVAQRFLSLCTIVTREEIKRVSVRADIEALVNADAKLYANKPLSDDYLISMVFVAEPHPGSAQRITLISSMVLGIQRFTTVRLTYQGVSKTQSVEPDSPLYECLVAHFKSKDAQFRDVLETMYIAEFPRLWSKNFTTNAGELSPRAQFVIRDPDAELLEKLYKNDSQ